VYTSLHAAPNTWPSNQQNSVNKPKPPSKARQEEAPNPAAPITKVRNRILPIYQDY